MLVLVNDPLLGMTVAHAEDCPAVEVARGLNWEIVPLVVLAGTDVDVLAHIPCALEG